MSSSKTRSIIKRTLVVLLIALVGIQFYRPARNENNAVTSNHITKVYTVPENVQVILQKACYDCHSNYTSYPWYNKIQPVAMWMDDHVNDGKRHLNFSEFGSYKLLRQSKKLVECAEEVEEGEMPLSSYTLMHGDAKLTAEEKNTIITWAKSLSGEIYSKVTPAEIEEDRKRREEREKKGK